MFLTENRRVTAYYNNTHIIKIKWTTEVKCGPKHQRLLMSCLH